LRGGIGRDYLDGGKNHDTMEGGADFDSYIADNEDSILDSDGKGSVVLNGNQLSGGKRKSSDPANIYKGGGNTYELNGTTLRINGGLVISNFRNGNLLINLETEPDDPPPPDVPRTSTTPSTKPPLS